MYDHNIVYTETKSHRRETGAAPGRSHRIRVRPDPIVPLTNIGQRRARELLELGEPVLEDPIAAAGA